MPLTMCYMIYAYIVSILKRCPFIPSKHQTKSSKDIQKLHVYCLYFAYSPCYIHVISYIHILIEQSMSEDTEFNEESADLKVCAFSNFERYLAVFDSFLSVSKRLYYLEIVQLENLS